MVLSSAWLPGLHEMGSAATADSWNCGVFDGAPVPEKTRNQFQQPDLHRWWNMSEFVLSSSSNANTGIRRHVAMAKEKMETNCCKSITRIGRMSLNLRTSIFWSNGFVIGFRCFDAPWTASVEAVHFHPACRHCRVASPRSSAFAEPLQRAGEKNKKRPAVLYKSIQYIYMYIRYKIHIHV